MSTQVSEHSASANVGHDERRELLHAWAQHTLGRGALQLTVASADASFRRYFRVRDPACDETWIVMDAPPTKEDVRPFITVAAMLAGAGVNAPRVIAQNLADGFLLLTDLGDRTYLTDLSADRNVEQLYSDAIIALIRMQTDCADARLLPPYDDALLHREMELFPEWFLGKHLGIAVDASMRRELDAAFSVLSNEALSQPRVFVHRDYHSRNLMITGTGRLGPNPGILDFQDAVYGPITYDLASLLRDCYVAWPLPRVHAWVDTYREQALAAGLDVGSTRDQFLRWFDWMGVQRHLKAIGIFARLWHRDGKRGYLGDIPRTLGYIRSVAPSYPELSDLLRLIEERVVPALAHT